MLRRSPSVSRLRCSGGAVRTGRSEFGPVDAPGRGAHATPGGRWGRGRPLGRAPLEIPGRLPRRRCRRRCGGRSIDPDSLFPQLGGLIRAPVRRSDGSGASRPRGWPPAAREPGIAGRALPAGLRPIGAAGGGATSSVPRMLPVVGPGCIRSRTSGEIPPAGDEIGHVGQLLATRRKPGSAREQITGGTAFRSRAGSSPRVSVVTRPRAASGGRAALDLVGPPVGMAAIPAVVDAVGGRSSSGSRARTRRRPSRTDPSGSRPTRGGPR